MTALPSATTATAAAATERDVKNYLIGLRDFLNGLLGATGVPADARAALGVSPLSADTIASALGYTPANSSHTHSAYVSTNMTHGAVGSLCFAYVHPPSSGTKYVPGSTIAGSLLRATGMDLTSGKSCYYSSYMSGTWRCLGNVEKVTGTGEYIAHTLFQRIS